MALKSEVPQNQWRWRQGPLGPVEPLEPWDLDLDPDLDLDLDLELHRMLAMAVCAWEHDSYPP